MANVLEPKRITGFQSLPPEIRHDIFRYVYPPWHFEYTQMHDTLPTDGPEDIGSAVARVAAELAGIPRFSNLPSIAPLLVCRDFHNAGSHIFGSSFTGHMYVISKMMWHEVHWTYACIMAKATTLTINLNHLKTLHQCRILDRLPNLKNVIVVCTAVPTSYGFQMTCQHEAYEDEPPRPFNRLSLEGPEITSFLPNNADLSDTTLQERWNDYISPEDDRLVNPFHAFYSYIDHLNHEVLLSMRVKTVARAVINMPVLPEYVDQGVTVFLILDFQRASWNGLAENSSEDPDPYILVRKRLVMLKREVLESSTSSSSSET